MQRTKNSRFWVLGLGLAIGLLALPAAADAQAYEITVTNLTKGQILSPPIVFTHRGSFALFTPGEPAIPELAAVAEDAASDALVALLGTEPGVADVSIGGGVVLPGESTTIPVSAAGDRRYVTALGMLVTTNDAFFAGTARVTGLTTSLYAPAWDAGSEVNTQDCAHIPGPPCGNGGVRVEDGAEGYVYIHSGIQDRGSLDPQDHDWRNPVAKVVIRRANR